MPRDSDSAWNGTQELDFYAHRFRLKFQKQILKKQLYNCFKIKKSGNA